MADEKILSYNDVVLRISDLDILSGRFFLNDRIIEFYFSYLTTCYPFEDILLVPPSIAFWLKECPDLSSLKDFIEPLHLSRRKLILFPINDNDNVSMAEGGSHWSLLAFESNANAFIHHDSSGGCSNSEHARKVFIALSYFMNPSTTYIESSDTPKQTNGYDCGLYVTASAKAICDWYASNQQKSDKDLWFSAVKEQVTPSLVSNMRREILELIQSLKAEK